MSSDAENLTTGGEAEIHASGAPLVHDQGHQVHPGSYRVDGFTDALHEAHELGMYALSEWPEFYNAHEGFAVMQEEVDKLWEWVKVRKSARNLDALRAQAVSVAMVALRIAAECTTEEAGRR